jgi:hypothetical protein
MEFGMGMDLSRDLGDSGLDQGAAQLGLGVGIRAPIRWSPHPVVALRADPSFAFHRGQDRVEWSQFGGAVSYASEDHWTMLTQVAIAAGPEISPWHESVLSPYIGSSVGIGWARHWHSFQGPSAILLDPDSNDLTSGSNIDPYTDQMVPMAGVHVGLRIHDVLPFALETELGYNVAFMREVPLSGARPALDAVRTAYGFNPVRLGVNAVFIR